MVRASDKGQWSGPAVRPRARARVGAPAWRVSFCAIARVRARVRVGVRVRGRVRVRARARVRDMVKVRVRLACQLLRDCARYC